MVLLDQWMIRDVVNLDDGFVRVQKNLSGANHCCLRCLSYNSLLLYICFG